MQDQQRNGKTVDMDEIFTIIANDGTSNLATIGAINALDPIKKLIRKMPLKGAEIVLIQAIELITEAVARSGVDAVFEGEKVTWVEVMEKMTTIGKDKFINRIITKP